MKTVRISDEVWDEIAKRGSFGESVDDVLRRVFELDSSGSLVRQKRTGKHAQHRMSAKVDNSSNEIIVQFEGGLSKSWPLPSRQDKDAVRALTRKVIEFAERSGGTGGQVNAARKALTDAGYTITK